MINSVSYGQNQLVFILEKMIILTEFKIIEDILMKILLKVLILVIDSDVVMFINLKN